MVIDDESHRIRNLVERGEDVRPHEPVQGKRVKVSREADALPELTCPSSYSTSFSWTTCNRVANPWTASRRSANRRVHSFFFVRTVILVAPVGNVPRRLKSWKIVLIASFWRRIPSYTHTHTHARVHAEAIMDGEGTRRKWRSNEILGSANTKKRGA